MKKLFPVILTVCLAAVLFVLAVVPAYAEESKDISENVSDTLPVIFDPDNDKFEVEDVFDEDGSGFNHGEFAGGFDYYYLKGEYGKTYMTFKFTVEEAGTYDFCIALMGLNSSVPRTMEFDINGVERFYVQRDYAEFGGDEGTAEYICDITGYLRAGENKITFYTGYDFDNVNIKSLFIDKVYYVRTGDLPDGYKFPGDGQEEETVDITGADPTIIKFNENFKSLITSVIYSKYEFVDDAEKGNVTKFTITENYPAQLSFSYSKYMKLLGLETENSVCDEYPFIVLTIKAEEDVYDGIVRFCPFTNGNTLIDEAYCTEEYYDVGKGWQKVLIEMSDNENWVGSFGGGCFFLSSGDESELDASFEVAELRLFKDYNEAAAFAGIKIAEKTTVAEVTTVAEETTVAEVTTATEVTTTVAEVATTAATEEATTAAEKTKSGCGSAVAFSLLLVTVPISFTAFRKKKND